MIHAVNYRKLIKSILGNEVSKIEEQNGNFYIYSRQNSTLRCLSILNTNEALQFSALTDCFAVQLPETTKVSIYYQLHSYKLDKTIFVITILNNTNELMQSVTILFENANWYEREIFDLFGIKFNDHPDMRKILTKTDCEINYDLAGNG